MTASLLSRRYAVALAEVAEKSGDLEKVRAELLALAEVLEGDPHLLFAARSAARSREEKRRTFEAVSGKLGLCRPTSRLLEYLVEHKRIEILPDLASSFAREADRRLNILRGELVSAVPLEPEQKARIVEALVERTGARIELEDKVDESLIAGFRVTLADRLFDGSLRNQLQRMKERLAHGARTIHTA